MPKVMVLQHVAFEILGTLNPLLKQAKCRIKYVNFSRHPQSKPNLTGYHGLVILGGPMSAYQLTELEHLQVEIKLIKEAIAKNIPILGICLGAQLIAAALGAKVYPNSVREIGWYDLKLEAAGTTDPLFIHFAESEKIFQWHGDTFDLPDEAIHLSSSATCKHQAFRFKDNVYGLQFHLEVDKNLIERWLTVPEHQSELAAVYPKITADKVRQDTNNYLARAHALSDKVFNSFIDIVCMHTNNAK